MRLRFTVRDLLWLAALVAVCVAWWVDHQTTVRNANRQIMGFQQIANDAIKASAELTQHPATQ